MKGDFTRDTFDPKRHYAGVLLQQGRVQLDADWREQWDIQRHHVVSRTTDLIGKHGGPAANAGFGLTVNAGGTVSISAGHYYVAGILCENDDATALVNQPDPPGADATLPSVAGLWLAYLDVWDRHITALDDPHIREVALGGPDTASRIRTTWQVKIKSLKDVTPELTAKTLEALAAARAAGDDKATSAALQKTRQLADAAYCKAPLDPLGGAHAAGTGHMAARAESDPAAPDDLCRFAPGGGYTRPENRLYRVEIHNGGAGGAGGTATFKYSADNGAFVVGIEEYLPVTRSTPTNRIRVRSLGPDYLRTMRLGAWVEVIADDEERAGQPGTMVRITNQPDPAERILELSAPVTRKALTQHPKVRHWDVANDTMKVRLNGWIDLDSGVQVRFYAGDFHTGDYWLIPARANTGEVDWPPFPNYPGEPVPTTVIPLPPEGIHHWRAPLAVLVHDGSQIVTAVDLRRLFPATTDLTSLHYAGGDGQEPVWPDGTLPQPLQVAVTNGSQPVEGALVTFEIIEGDGQLSGGGPFTSSVTVASNVDGIAGVDWRLAANKLKHRVRARLLDRCAHETHVPVFFNSHVNYQLHYLSGDGQEGMPGEKLPALRVWASDGRWPIKGAQVQFDVIQGNGSLSDYLVVTNGNGVAETTWKLGTNPKVPRQRVQARLLDAQGNLVQEAALIFNANLSLASQVWYDPSDCLNPNHPGNVQQALDDLCGNYAVYYVGGDGQEAAPTQALPLALQVRVANGQWPVSGANVVFRVTQGGGSVLSAAGAGAEIPAATSAEGRASVAWTLGSAGTQEVLAFLEGREDLAIVFNATLRTAESVSFDPTACPRFDDTVTNVQLAIDALCDKTLAADEGIHIKELILSSRGKSLINDAVYPVDAFAPGLRFICDRSPDPDSLINKPVCSVTLDLPYPLSAADRNLWSIAETVGFQPIVLAADLKPTNEVIDWIPSASTRGWLINRLFQTLAKAKAKQRVLVRLTLKGNFIWDRDDRAMHLDGEVFGAPAGGRTDLILPSGNRLRGGDLESWFWIVPSASAGPAVVAVKDFTATIEGVPIAIPVLANDSGTQPLGIAAVGRIPSGSTTAVSGDFIRYTPREGFTGTDTFEYTLRDATGKEAQGLVTVRVVPKMTTATTGGRAIVALAETSLVKGTVAEVSGSGFIANETVTLVATAADGTAIEIGMATADVTGSFAEDVRVLESVPAGEYTIRAIGERGSVSGSENRRTIREP